MTTKDALKKYTCTSGINNITPTVTKVLEEKVKDIITIVRNYEDNLAKKYKYFYTFVDFLCEIVYEDGYYGYDYKLYLMSQSDALSCINIAKTIENYKNFVYFKYYKYDVFNGSIFGIIRIPIEFFLLKDTELINKLLLIKIDKCKEEKLKWLEKILAVTEHIKEINTDIDLFTNIMNDKDLIKR